LGRKAPTERIYTGRGHSKADEQVGKRNVASAKLRATRVVVALKTKQGLLWMFLLCGVIFHGDNPKAVMVETITEKQFRN
jgi:hypothetical protein